MLLLPLSIVADCLLLLLLLLLVDDDAAAEEESTKMSSKSSIVEAAVQCGVCLDAVQRMLLWLRGVGVLAW